MRKSIPIIIALLLLILCCRGIIYRLLIKYKAVGTRAGIEITNPDLIEQIELESGDEVMTIAQIAKIADGITSRQLSFTGGKASNNPNELMVLGQANCIGYSAMFHAIASHLIKKYHLDNEIISTHKIGQMELLGVDIHQFFDHTFFRDHDYNVLSNTKTGKSIAVDPSVSDYLWIKRIAEY
ncbi:MAG: hypothetical protein AAGI49_00555 [Bacteroidota bacterium]